MCRHSASPFRFDWSDDYFVVATSGKCSQQRTGSRASQQKHGFCSFPQAPSIYILRIFYNYGQSALKLLKHTILSFPLKIRKLPLRRRYAYWSTLSLSWQPTKPAVSSAAGRPDGAARCALTGCRGCFSHRTTPLGHDDTDGGASELLRSYCALTKRCHVMQTCRHVFMSPRATG